MPKTEIIAEPGTHEVLIKREFDAPRDLLFRAYTEPDLLVQWMGPRTMSMKVEALDARHGGEWRYIHSDPNGNEAAFHGVFHNTPSPDAIVRTFEYDGMPGHVSMETVTFEERGGKTLVRMSAVFQSIEDRDGMVASGMESGVNDGMERLDELLARLVPIS